MTAPRTLIAWHSRSGHTRSIAEALRQMLAADLFEIRPATPYPADYDEHVAQSRVERDSGFETPLATLVPDITAYDEILLGFPIWAGNAPSPVKTFLKAHDLAGKTLRPFITHGGYGIGESLGLLAAYVPTARIEPVLIIDTEKPWSLDDEVAGWLALRQG